MMTGTRQRRGSFKRRETGSTRIDVNNSSTGGSTSTYVQVGGFHGTQAAVQKRIRTPHPHDVLCGRGGGINSHPGNKTFREWVRQRKNLYNLATSKQEKARVSKEIVEMVRALNPPGKFLQRDPGTHTSSSLTGLWTEIDEAKALAKTSQALREGAPNIRAEHRHEIDGKVSATQRLRKRTISEDDAADSEGTQPRRQAPGKRQGTRAYSHAVQVDGEDPGEKKVQAYEEDVHVHIGGKTLPQSSPLTARLFAAQKGFKKQKLADQKEVLPARERIDQMAPTPPPEVEVVETPELRPVPLASSIPLSFAPDGALAPTKSLPPAEKEMARSNSLALSDIDHAELLDQEFVNPFEDEDEHVSCPSKVAPSGIEQTKRPLVRTLTSTSSSSVQSYGDLGGIGALFQSKPEISRQRSGISSNNSNGGNNIINNGLGSKKSVRNMSSRSITSELSDLPDARCRPPDQVNFDEEMKTVYDVAHPDLTVPRGGEAIPTHLYPYGGSGRRRISRTKSSKTGAHRRVVRTLSKGIDCSSEQ